MKKLFKGIPFILCAVMLIAPLSACKESALVSSNESTIQTTTSEVSTTQTSQDEQSLDSDTAYWSGFNFGPNLEYAEEFEISKDLSGYTNAPEAAKYVFDTMRDNDHIPEYSDGTNYIMVLVDLTEIEGEQCYVYRLDVDEPTGTIGAAYAYAYESENIYMQGFGGQWLLETTSGTDFSPEWVGDYYSDDYVVSIYNFDGEGIDFEIYKLDEPATTTSGYATLYSDNNLMAEFDQISFSLYEDYSVLNIFAPESHDLSILRGQYVKNEYAG